MLFGRWRMRRSRYGAGKSPFLRLRGDKPFDSERMRRASRCLEPQTAKGARLSKSREAWKISPKGCFPDLGCGGYQCTPSAARVELGERWSDARQGSPP